MILGAQVKDGTACDFLVWAPYARDVSLKFVSQSDRVVSMQPLDHGYWKGEVSDVQPGELYVYLLDGERERPDPASHYQPGGVHASSCVVDHAAFQWSDEEWRGIDLSEMIMYEMHIGTFTPEGTFDGVLSRIDELRKLGVNAIEIMPVTQFPGERNWGYDGVYPYAVQNSYGGPAGLKRLVNECHRKNVAVILDVVYNHLGPEGNYLGDFGPYFTDRYRTPWGRAINFDGEYSNEVRRYFIENAIFWLRHYHIDALRLDAIHGIFDMSARPFLMVCAESVKKFAREEQRKVFLIAESDLNNSFVVKPASCGGFDLDALWCDDFHHSVHSLITGEKDGYYSDFGDVKHVEKALREGFVYSGQYSVFRKKNHGNSSRDLAPCQFIAFSQNHDQIGNRMKGERLSSLVSFEALKLVAGVVILSPYQPLIFMGEEYAETAPFHYFVSHSDVNLIKGVREGRKREFEAFNWGEEPPDPQHPDTFFDSKIKWGKRERGMHKVLWDFYTELIRIRKHELPLAHPDREGISIASDPKNETLVMHRVKQDHRILIIFNFRKRVSVIRAFDDETKWRLVLLSSDTQWHGPGSLASGRNSREEGITMSAESFALYSNR